MKQTSKLKAFAAGLLALAASTGLSFANAPSADWAAIVEAAKKEGTVTIYSGQGLKQLNDMATRFKAKYGIDVQVVRALETDFIPKVEAEFRTGAGIADVYVITVKPRLDAQQAEGYFVPVVGPAFDNPDYNRAERAPEGVSFEVSAAPMTFSWNTELWPQGLKTTADILDPGLKGQVGIMRPSVATFVDFYSYMTDLYGADFMERLAAQEPRIYPGALAMAQALGAGEVAAIIYGEVQTDEKAAGAPVDSGFEEKPWGARFYGNVLKTAPHPNAAQLLADFMVSQEGQEVLARKAGSVLPDIAGAVIHNSRVRHLDWDRLSPKAVEDFVTRFNELFDEK